PYFTSYFSFVLLLPPPPRHTLFPYTTLFRSIANGVQVFFNDGTSTENIESEFPLGHRFRRDEALPQIREKYKNNMATNYSQKQLDEIEKVSYDYEAISEMNVEEFMSLLI